MKELLEFIVKAITGSDEVSVEESTEDGRVKLTVLAPADHIGLIIGKGGSTIRAIRNIVRVKGTLDKKAVYVEILEKDEKK